MLSECFERRGMSVKAEGKETLMGSDEMRGDDTIQDCQSSPPPMAENLISQQRARHQSHGLEQSGDLHSSTNIR